MNIVAAPMRAPRICVPSGAGGDAAQAAALGFDTLLIPAGAGLAAATAEARAHSLAVLADLRVDRLPASDVRGPAATVFTVLPAPMRDPRQAPRLSDHAVSALRGPEDVETFASWLAQQVDGACAAGAAGVRLLGLDSLPAALVPSLLSRLRALASSAVLFAWTPGLSWEVLRAMAPGSVDLVASSLPHWDGQADWLWRELEMLRQIAPVVAPAGGDVGVAALLADGWMTPLHADLSGWTETALNALRGGPGFGSSPARPLTGPGSPVLALLRTDAPDPRRAGHATLLLVNTGAHPAEAVASAILRETGGIFGPFEAVLPAGGEALRPGATPILQPHEMRVYQAAAQPLPASGPVSTESAVQAAHAPRLAIEAPTPCVDGGRFPARRIVGTAVEVQADIIGDGHDKLAAALRWQAPGSDAWHEAPMALINNDRWTSSFPLESLGIHRYEVHAWRPAYDTYADELTKKHKAGVPIVLELQEGIILVGRAAERPSPAQARLAELHARLEGLDPDGRRELLLSAEMAELMHQADNRLHLATFGPVPIQAERTAAGFASWYEVFPRSMSDDPHRHGTFRDVERHLPRIRDMGFDVLYFPPFHPIGRKNRKGRNNSLTAGPDDPGSPYAIGAEAGGHDALHPELGTLEDFAHLRQACAEHGLELAMDFAIQCSPDHPWLREHKDWFNWRPDGSIRYAENPPKKYEDIVNVDFYAPGAVPGLWMELCRVVLFWAEQGVRLFRVDNPHTKPLPFWEWMIAAVQARFPDAVFLAEAFTRPKVMYRLAKVGFSQSYTYFTWREHKWEFQEYLTELTGGPPREFFRPHFFVNTPDINPLYLQNAGRSAYLVRAVLAATLSGLWGVYNGFELCEGTPVPGKEEYLDSEKYQLRAWDWDRPGNIVREITELNAIRRLNPALHTHLGVTFLPSSSDRVLFYQKQSADRSNTVLVAVSMDPSGPQGSALTMPGTEAVDLLTGQPVRWADQVQHINLSPDRPYAIWRLSAAV